MGELVTIPNSTATGALSGGHICTTCGQWVPTGMGHACMGHVPVAPWPVAPAPQVVYLHDPAFERIAKALERLTELLEAKL
jgi:hypothetical protein